MCYSYVGLVDMVDLVHLAVETIETLVRLLASELSSSFGVGVLTILKSIARAQAGADLQTSAELMRNNDIFMMPVASVMGRQ